MSLENEIAVVSGATRGIGKAIVLELGNEGAYVVGTATSESGASEIRSYLSENGLKGKAFVLDVSRTDSVNDFFQTLKEMELTPTILVNNAGITRDNLIVRMKEEEWDSVINTNLTSVYRMCKFCVRGMLKARKGRIINITSLAALTGNDGQSNYAATKAGILGLTKSLALELSSRKITVNAVAPGYIETDMTDKIPEAQRLRLLKTIPLARLGRVEEIAKAVSFLASDTSGYITGETINVNGGKRMD